MHRWLMEADIKHVEVVVRFALKWYRTNTSVLYCDVVTPGVQLFLDWLRKLWSWKFENYRWKLWQPTACSSSVWQLNVGRLMKKMSTFYLPWMFSTVFTKPCWTYVKPREFNFPLVPYFFKINFNISSPLRGFQFDILTSSSWIGILY